MAFVKLTACGSLLAFGLAMSAQASVIADFNGDYVVGTQGQTRGQASADGWNYMWNDGAHDWGGPLGTDYENLTYCAAQARYTSTGDYPGYFPGYYVYVSKGGIMPGEGTQQIGTSDSFAIAAYTIQPGEAGLVSITDSSFSAPDAASTGVEFRVYVNNTDTYITSFVQAGGAAASSFNASLGSLKVGDTVYVAVGPNGINYNDQSVLSYKLTSTPTPEPATGAIALTAGLAGLLAYAWRKRR